MRLGEALARRSDLQKRIAQLHDRLRASVVIQEGDTPPEAAGELLLEAQSLTDELERLVVAINRTNGQAVMASGKTLTDALAHRDALGLRQGILATAIAAAADARAARYSRSEIRFVRQVDVGELRAQLDRLAKERRELDGDIQAQNWTQALIEGEN